MKDSKRGDRRVAGERKIRRTRVAVSNNTGGLWRPDDPACIRCVYKRNHVSPKGRLRLDKGALPGASRRRKVDAETLAEVLG